MRTQADQLSDNGLLIFDIYPADDKQEIFEVDKFSCENMYVARTFYAFAKGKKLYFELIHMIVENRKRRLIVEKGVILLANLLRAVMRVKTYNLAAKTGE